MHWFLKNHEDPPVLEPDANLGKIRLYCLTALVLKNFEQVQRKAQGSQRNSTISIICCKMSSRINAVEASPKNVYDTVQFSNARPAATLVNAGNGPTQVERRICFFIGRSGSGKTTAYSCLTNSGARPVQSLFAGTKKTCGGSFAEGNMELQVFDTVGFTGQYDSDRRELAKAIKEMQNEGAGRYHCVFLCFAAGRFDTVDQSILNMIRNETSKDFQDRIVVVISCCPSAVSATIKSEVERVITFLPNLRDRCITVDLKDYTTDTNVLVQETVEYWARVRIQLRSIAMEHRAAAQMDDVFLSAIKYIWDTLLGGK